MFFFSGTFKLRFVSIAARNGDFWRGNEAMLSGDDRVTRLGEFSPIG
jgi:hypothetical protein